MFTIVKAVKILTFNSWILYISYLGEQYTTVLSSISKNQISEIKTQTDYKLLSLKILMIFGQLKQNEYKYPI